MPGTKPTTHLLYLHGFRSSPQSFKAQRVQAWLSAHRPGVHWWCPQLPASPAAAMELVRRGTADWPADACAVVGSSLGGYYATALAVERGWPAAVLNPAVDPADDLARWIGEQPAFHDPAERIHFRAEYIDELRALRLPDAVLPTRCLAIVASGDEVIDPRAMRARYAAATDFHPVEGSDHALSDFDDHLPHLLQFLKPCD